ncbi:Multidrug resistance-associated protein [Blattamonas nauphoetae]|uniref:Multidrug resistance-associated protein n=1 Tax=Blattamonas nauphoetae TaxID=2049346 RepID=A0ABQ9XZA8_9EUKA|nr:Multidrug resistance-associated protein [Blattamonas nauphoetae]
MSGGQKARIQRGRAMHTERDIYVLDDPLSAVDAHVGSYLIDKCISGVLKGTIVILMTNQLQFLDRADKVIALENGRITAQGTCAEIREQGVNFDQFIIKSDKKAAEKKLKKVEVKEAEKTDDDNAKQIITEEGQETGGIKFMLSVKSLRSLTPMGIMIMSLLYVVTAEAVSSIHG